jgi:HEAT repeat protein
MPFLLGLFGAHNIGKLKGKGDIHGLLKALEHPKNPRVRKAAAEALGELGDETASEPLATAAFDEEQDVRIAAIEALGGIGDEGAVHALIKILKGLIITSTESKAAAMALIRLGSRAIPALVSTVLDQDEDENRRLATIRVLGAIGSPEAQDGLMKVLEEDPEFTIFDGAADALHAVGDAHVVDRLLALASGEDYFRAARAAHVLGNNKDDRAIEPLCALLDKPESESLRGEVIVAALANYYDPRTVEALIQALEKDHTMAKAAAQVLEVWAKITVDPLIEALRHENDKVQNWAAILLGKIGDKRAIEPLEALLNDLHFSAKRSAKGALRSLGVKVED